LLAFTFYHFFQQSDQDCWAADRPPEHIRAPDNGDFKESIWCAPCWSYQDVRYGRAERPPPFWRLKIGLCL